MCGFQSEAGLRKRQLDHYFPQYHAMSVVPVFISLRMPEKMVRYLTRQGIYALAVGEEMMEVLKTDHGHRPPLL